jgi:hypothetical protein
MPVAQKRTIRYWRIDIKSGEQPLGVQGKGKRVAKEMGISKSDVYRELQKDGKK